MTETTHEGPQMVQVTIELPQRLVNFYDDLVSAGLYRNMLRWIGFDNAAVLDGGMDRWEAEGRPITTERFSYPPGTLTARPRPGLFVDREEMLAAIGDDAVCSLNALDPALHSGENPRYGRPGRIPGSTNVPAASLLDPATKFFLPLDCAARAFDEAGAMPGKRILNYCGAMSFVRKTERRAVWASCAPNTRAAPLSQLAVL